MLPNQLTKCIYYLLLCSLCKNSVLTVCLLLFKATSVTVSSYYVNALCYSVTYIDHGTKVTINCLLNI